MTTFDTDLWRPRFSRSAIWLSIVMHILLVYGLLDEELLWAKLKVADAQPVTDVELVPETPKPRPSKPPPLPQIDEPKPEPPKTEQPKPEAPQPEAVEPPPLTVPQLIPGRLAERSSVPHPAARNGTGGEGQALAMSSGPGFTLLPKAQAKAGRPGSTGQEGPELTQSEQDVILAQVLKYWNVNFHAPEAHGLVLEGVFYVQADGTLASPFNKNDPWNPAAVVRGYAELARAGTSFRKDAMDGFLLALRLCQPLQLPSSKGVWPRKIVIRFAFDSL